MSDPTFFENEAVLFSEDDSLFLMDAENTIQDTDPTGAGAAPIRPIPVPPSLPQPIPLPLPQPFPVPQLPKRRVSGRYRSGGNGFQLELRVDVDGARAMRCVSGDFFQVNGATTTYFGSFTAKAVSVTTTSSLVTIEGTGQFTWAATATKIKVKIPRVSILQPPATASIQYSTPAGVAGATYSCPYVSPFFRTVQYEQDSVAGTVPFVSYNTAALPQPASSPARTLSVGAAYAEAGIEMQSAGTVNVINNSEAGVDAAWDDAELHSAMVRHFSQWTNTPQWKVWLVVATRHVAGYRGIMFDYADAVQRQGCAVFYDAIQGLDATKQRAQLRTYVHELGHCFNLMHSWQKNLATPPAPLGPSGGFGDLSWMNYAQNYQPGGTAGYWSNFPFQFTNSELVHLRHGFYRNVVLGGNAFGAGAAEINPETIADRIEDNSGLRLELRGKETFAFGEPVVVELKLSLLDLRGKDVHGRLHPNDSFVQIAIQQPSGRVVRYRPLIEHCADDEATHRLTSDKAALYDSAYIGYGKDGFYFDQPGVYQLRATFAAPDGSHVVSQTFRLRVRAPHTATDEEVGELLLGHEQGQLFYLLGSDAESLSKGNATFDLLLDKHAKHPLAVYARLVKGVNAGRDFKSFGDSQAVTVRKAQTTESTQHLAAVVEASTAEKGVDNITLNLAMRRLAQAQSKAGDMKKASATLDKMVQVFKQKKLKASVIQQISAEAEVAKAELKQA